MRKYPAKKPTKKPAKVTLNLQTTIELDTHHRFISILTLVAGLHVFLLLFFNFNPMLVPLKKMMATMLEVRSEVTVQIEKLSEPVKPPPSVTAPQSDAQLQTLQKVVKQPEKILLRKRTVSAAAHQTKDADYLARWQNYVEDFGNAHYPEVAVKNNLRGNLRLLVAVKRDGSLYEVSLRQSSGFPLLDQAAIDLVKKASPFEPLPIEIAQDIEVLEIIRTWQFKGKLSTR